MKKLTRWITILLAVCLMVTMLPAVSGFASEETKTEAVQTVEVAEPETVAAVEPETEPVASEPVVSEPVVQEETAPAVTEAAAPETVAAQPAAEEPAKTIEAATAILEAAVAESYNQVEPSVTVQETVSNQVFYAAAQPFAYSGDTVMFMKDNGDEFGMWRLQEGSTYGLKDGMVVMHLVPNNKTVFGGFVFGSIGDIAEGQTAFDYPVNDDGTIDLVLSTDYCGLATPIAPIKRAERGGGTSGTQYYLAIPSADKLENLEPEDLDAAADYSKVEAAKAKVPEDLSKYTDESVKALQAALDAVEEGKKVSEQEAVDAMAKAIEDAIAALELKPAEGRTDLTITNTTGMFKVVSAYLLTKDGKTELVMALSGSGYHDLFKGTYEDAVANGDNFSNWIHGTINDAGKWEFRIPISEGETYVPCVAISDTYVQNYRKGKNSLERSFFPRQVEINVEKKTLVTGDYAYEQKLEITNHVQMFKPESAVLATVGGPNSNNYKADLLLTMGSDAFDKIFIGTKTDAEKAEVTYAINGRLFTVPVRWVVSFGKPETMQTLVGQKFVMSFHSVKNNTWYERIFLINEKNGTLVIDPVDEEHPVGPSPVTPVVPTPGGNNGGDGHNYETNVDGGTAVVDNSTALADGVYAPDKFSFSGGAGRVVLNCSKVEVKGGKAYATIVFSNIQSGTAEFGYVKASGGTYYCTQVGPNSVVTIPVELNKNNPLLAMTTKMSNAHEIAYTIFVYIAGADAKGGTALTENKEFDTEAPVIAGLEAEGEEKIDKAEYFKIFNYSDGIRLLEIDMRIDKDKEEAEGEAEAEKEETEAVKEETVIDEETGAELQQIAGTADAQTELYKGNIIKYLLVPEDVEIPAGLDKEAIVVQLPIKSIYSGSEGISKIMKELMIDDLIKVQEKEDKEKEIAGAGDYKELNLKVLVKNKCDIILLSNDILKDKKEKKYFTALGEDLANLEIAAIVDRSEMEKSDEAKAEWMKVYGILFGCEKAAQAAYEAAVK